VNTVLERLAVFKIPHGLLEAAGVRSASDTQVRELLGVHGRTRQDLSGMVFPYRDPRDGRTLSHRVRLDSPVDRQKYLSAQGSRTLFFAPIQGQELTDTSVPAVIVEAEKSALALSALAGRHERKLLVIAVGGVWGWRRKTGTVLSPDGNRQSVTGPSPSLDWISWTHRKTIIVFDSNVAGRRDLETARRDFAAELSRRGAHVFIATVPLGKGVNGPDDLVAVAGDAAALQMLDRAAPFSVAKAAPVPGVLASDVKPEEVRWLWRNRIPRGKLTIFDGDPDEGKSTVTLDLAARLTRGRTMPDGCQTGCVPAGVVMISLEDGVADTIRPRLESAGAALERVRIVSAIKDARGFNRTPTIPDDLPAIEAAVRDVNAALLVIDPLVAMLGPQTNSYRDQDIRRALAPLADLGERTGVAVICVRHLNKTGGSNPKYRGGGSIGIIGAARAAFLFADAPGRDGVHVMAPVKGNLWRSKPAALEYVIVEKGGQPVIEWQGESQYSAQSLLAQPESIEESNALTDAKNFLRQFLKDGPRDATDVIQEARRAGVSERTLYRAKASLGIVSSKPGMAEGWLWEFPKAAIAPAKIANVEGLAIFDQASEITPVTSTSSPKAANYDEIAMLEASSGNLHKASDGDVIEV
jgi:AAA domain/Domain of unknown function (DUF3854)